MDLFFEIRLFVVVRELRGRLTKLPLPHNEVVCICYDFIQICPVLGDYLLRHPPVSLNHLYLFRKNDLLSPQSPIIFFQIELVCLLTKFLLLLRHVLLLVDILLSSHLFSLQNGLRNNVVLDGKIHNLLLILLLPPKLLSDVRFVSSNVPLLLVKRPILFELHKLWSYLAEAGVIVADLVR